LGPIPNPQSPIPNPQNFLLFYIENFLIGEIKFELEYYNVILLFSKQLRYK